MENTNGLKKATTVTEGSIVDQCYTYIAEIKAYENENGRMISIVIPDFGARDIYDVELNHINTIADIEAACKDMLAAEISCYLDNAKSLPTPSTDVEGWVIMVMESEVDKYRIF